jgi:hypothetical protein
MRLPKNFKLTREDVRKAFVHKNLTDEQADRILALVRGLSEVITVLDCEVEIENNAKGDD